MSSRPAQSEQDLIAAMIDDEVNNFRERLEWQVEHVCGFCESPIERVFGAALVSYNQAQPSEEYVHIYGRGADIKAHFPGTHVYPQAEVDGFRLDFLFVHEDQAGGIFYTIVELDGHDFHERTKQQASRDKARDRHFTRKGWRVVRFTGSDVWREASECVGEALIIAENLGRHMK